MSIKDLIDEFPEQFAEYAEKILDSYFGNIFVTYRNERILFVNEKLASSINMSKDDVTKMSLTELRDQKFWLRSVSHEIYTQKKEAFNAFNVSKWGEELFTYIAPIHGDDGEILMSVHFSIPKQMLTKFSNYIDLEKKLLQNYKDIADYLDAKREAAEHIICESPAAKLVFSEALNISNMDSTVLIVGETGSGKDVLANYIYRHSTRADKPFIPVNCSAIPTELMESEFFGYERGAFTGARHSGKPGLFEMASGGTIFLDEIGELPMAMQSKLLRVLETGEIIHIGGTRVIKTNVRIIVATNRDLKKMVTEKKFREDLFYRLNVVPINVPPLRERQNDILPLAQMFLDQNNRKYRQKRILFQELQQGLINYSWPGNIRELRNVIERYAISGRVDLEIVHSAKYVVLENTPTPDAWPNEYPSLKDTCAEFESSYIKKTLKLNNGSVTKAADMLGIHRSLLYKKINKYRI